MIIVEFYNNFYEFGWKFHSLSFTHCFQWKCNFLKKHYSTRCKILMLDFHRIKCNMESWISEKFSLRDGSAVDKVLAFFPIKIPNNPSREMDSFSASRAVSEAPLSGMMHKLTRRKSSTKFLLRSIHPSSIIQKICVINFQQNKWAPGVMQSYGFCVEIDVLYSHRKYFHHDLTTSLIKDVLLSTWNLLMRLIFHCRNNNEKSIVKCI